MELKEAIFDFRFCELNMIKCLRGESMMRALRARLAARRACLK